jgi:hypothetical protein
MNRPVRPSKTGITGSPRDTASDITHACRKHTMRFCCGRGPISIPASSSACRRTNPKRASWTPGCPGQPSLCSAITTAHCSFGAIAGLATHSLTLTGYGEPAEVSTVAVSADFFSLFGTQPLLGRALLSEDGKESAAPVVVLSENLWRSRFGADPNIVGRVIKLDQRSFTVAGVMQGSFGTPFVGRKDQIWIPLVQDPLFSGWRTRPPQAHWLPAIARLRPGVYIAEARAELQTIGAELAHQFPAESGWQPGIQPLQQVIVGDVKTPATRALVRGKPRLFDRLP